MIQLLISDAVQITDGPHGLIVHYNHQSIPLIAGRAESTLVNLFSHVRMGINPSRITTHLRDHQPSTVMDAHCPCCKLEGRILQALGRRRATEADRLIARRAHTGGTVQVRHIKSGLSGAQLLAQEEARLKYKAKAHKPTHPVPQRFVKARIEDLI